MRRLLRRLGGRAVRRVHEMNTLYDTPQGTLRKHGRLMRLREESTLRGKESGIPSHSFGTSRGQGSLRFAQGKHGLQKKRGMREQGKARVGARDVLTFKWPGKLGSDEQEAQAFRLRYESAGQAGKPVLREAVGRRGHERYKVREEVEYIVSEPRAVVALAGQAGMRPVFLYEKYRTSYRVPGAGGVHVEFDETPAGVFLELEGSRRGIDRLARRLGYRSADYISKSYAAVHFEDCRRRGIRARDMLFGTKKSYRNLHSFLDKASK
jgi:adenylate cyclase class IV